MSWKIKTIIALSALLTVLFLFVSAVQADVAASNPLYAWDKNAQIYKSSDADLRWDNSYLPFITELAFDPQPYFPTACPESGSRWSGELTFSLYHTDNDPPLAQGFQSTRNWKLVDCDRNNDGSFDVNDLTAQPPEGFNTLMSLSPHVVDMHISCTSQHCQEEIVTTVEINLDGNCDGVRDPVFPAHVCFYSEARSPQAGLDPYWRGYIQAEVSTPGSTQVVNFRIQNPTSVSVTKFAASSMTPFQGPLVFSLAIIVGALPFGWRMMRRK